MNHYHVIVWCYSERKGENYMEVRKMDLLVNNCERKEIISMAISMAKEIIETNFYEVMNIIEHEPHEKE